MCYTNVKTWEIYKEVRASDRKMALGKSLHKIKPT